MPVRKKVLLSLLVMSLGLTLGYCARYSQIPDPAPPLTPAPTARPAPTPVQPQLPPQDEGELIQQLEAGFFHPVTFEEPWHPFLDDEPHDVSVSVGTVSTGYLVNAAALPLPARDYRILPRQHQRGLVYGSQELIELLQHAGHQLYQKHERPLWLGNIGQRGGGDIRWSVSHNSGRDADLAFCYVDPQGQPVDPPDLVQLDHNGHSLKYDGYYRFDTRRTWTLVKALLTWRGAHLQYIFVSNPLRKMLLDHARQRREPLWLQQRAAEVLAQPGGAAPHDDHLHVRIYCSAQDLASGCHNLGDVPQEALHSQEVQQRLRQVGQHLKHKDPEQRARAVEKLALARAWSYLPAMAQALEDESPRPRQAAARALRQMGRPSHIPALVKAFQAETDPVAMGEMLRTLGLLGGPKAGDLLAQVILDKSYDRAVVGPLPDEIAACYQPPPLVPEAQEGEAVDPAMAPVASPNPRGAVLALEDRKLHVRLVAIEVAALSDRPEPVPALIEVLREEDPLLRDRAARALQRITNHSTDLVWAAPQLQRQAIEEGVQTWRQWWARFSKKSRDAWLIAGFQSRDFQVAKVDHRALWELTRATLAPEHLSYNAQRLLMRLTGHKPQSLDWPKDDACWHWTRWLKKRRRQLRIPEVPDQLRPCDK